MKSGDIVMWKIKSVKQTGKKAFKANYWVSFAIVFTLAALSIVPAIGSNLVTFKLDSRIEYTLYRILNFYFNPIQIAIMILAAITILILLIAVAILIYVYFSCPVKVGSAKYFLESNKGKTDAGNLMFSFKKGQYKSIVKAVFLKDLFIALWSLLFIVPGIIASYRWRLVDYLIAENPEMPAKEAREKSAELMNGNKFKSFGFDLSFIGWYILAVITFGIVGFFWVEPFRLHSDAALYATIKAEKEPKPAAKKTPAKKATAEKVEAKATGVVKKAPAKKATTKTTKTTEK